MKNLRAAFCFSGQLRTWKACYPGWLEFASMFETPPDIFCHLWDFNSNSARIVQITSESNAQIIPQNEIEEFLNIMKPKKYVIDSINRSTDVDFKMHLKTMELIGRESDKSVYWQASQFYSNMYSAFIKREYELENNFQYDICFRMRYDMILSETNIKTLFSNPIRCNDTLLPLNKPEPNTLYSAHSGILPNWPWVSVGDIFYFGDSLMFDRFSLYYFRMAEIYVNSFRCVIAKPENYLYFYLKSIMGNHKPLACELRIVRDKQYEKIVKETNNSLYTCDVIIQDNV